MKKFLAIYLGTTDGEKMEKFKALDEATRKATEKAGMEGWIKWMQDHEPSIIEQGSPLGKTKRISDSGISDVHNELSGWIVIEAESHEEAAKMFENHPHFAIFPGESIEVMECLPIPEM